MDTKTAVHSRRTIHIYQPDIEISEEFLKQGLLGALTAPNHKLSFPWKFLIVGPKTRERLAELACSIEEEKKGEPLSESTREAKKSKFLDPSALVVFCRECSDDEFTAREDYASIACAIENFSLLMTDQGWGTKWSTGKITTHPRTCELLGVDSCRYAIEGFVWVGKPAVEPKPQKRPNLEEVLTILE